MDPGEDHAQEVAKTDAPDSKAKKVMNVAKKAMNALSMEEVMNAAKTDALQDDKTCVRGPPDIGLPGLRYGTSIEMRPMTMIMPCPCAGGVWNPPHADDGAELDATGLWHNPQDRWPRSAIAG